MTTQKKLEEDMVGDNPISEETSADDMLTEVMPESKEEPLNG
jgi:hypothetical protein